MADFGSLRLAVQGLRFRRGVAASVLVVAVITIAAAAVGPVFARAGSESMLRDLLLTSPLSATGISVQQNTTPTPAALGNLDAQLPAAPALPGFPNRIRSLQVNGALAGPRDNAVLARGRFVWREGACEHLRFLAGDCPTTARTIAVSTRSARLFGWHLGTSLLAQGFASPTPRPPAVTVVGLYSPINAGDRYWFDFPYFDAGENDGSDIDSVFVAESTMAEAQGVGRVAIELPLDVAAVRLANVDRVRRAADGVLAQFAALIGGDVTVTNNLDQLLARAAHERQQLTVLVNLVALQLLVLGYLVLYLLVASASDARGPELALARLRGGRARSAIAFGLLEPVILLALALPLGLLVAFGFVEVVRRSLLTATPVTLPLSSVLGALGALCGGMIAAGLATRRTLRRPVAEQLRRVATEHVPGELAGRVDVAVIVLAVAGLVELRLSGGVSNGKVDNLALLTPGLLALAAALLGVRLLPVAVRGMSWGTRNRRDVGMFLALRQLTRRPAVLRVVILLGTAVGLATFAVAVSTTAAANRAARAATEVGADRVVLVVPVSAQQLVASVRRLDPDGRWAMAVQQYDPFANQPGGSLLAVDSPRLPAVATWRSDFAPAALPRLAAALDPRLPPPVVVVGSALRVRVLVTRLIAQVPLDLHALLARYSGGTVEVDLGRLAPGERDYTASLNSCASPCRLVGLTVARPLAEYPRIAGTLVIRGIAERGPGGWAAVRAGLADPRRWQPTLPRDESSGTDSLLATAVGLRYDFTARSTDVPGVAPIDAPSPLPAVSTRQAFGTSFVGAYPITGLDGQPATAEEVGGLATVLPRVQDDGTMVDLTYAGRTMTGGLANTSSEVWLGARAPADALRRIAALGLGVISVDSTRDHRARLDRSGPALGLVLFLVGAALATLLAVAGTVVSVYLTGRRRAFEVAALRAVGLTSGSLLRAAVLEQALLLLAGLVVGAAAGLVAAVLALPSVPMFADGRAVPPLRLGLHAVPLVLLVVGITALLVAVAMLAGWALIRSAVPARLREAQP